MLPVPPGVPALPTPPVSPRPRTFRCSDALWDSLERAAREQSRTVDQLLQEALTRYLQPSGAHAAPLPPAPPSAPRIERPTMPVPPPSLRGSPAPRPPLPSLPRSVPGAPPPLPLQPPAPLIAAPPLPPPPSRQPPPLPPSPTPPRPLPALANGGLAILHNGKRHDVDVPGFAIGRGKQLAGLSIRDPNISRRHAIIEREHGVYYLVDMGSTNGTHVNGHPIKRHAIREGDVVRIADEELIFTFRR